MIVPIELLVGTIIGLIVGVPFWASLHWAVAIALKGLAGLRSFIVISLLTGSFSADQLVNAVEVHHQLIIGALAGIGVVGIIVTAVRHVEKR